MSELEFPRLVYRSPVDHLLVDDVERFRTSLNEGWFDTVPEALAAKSAKPVIKPVESSKTTKAGHELDKKAIRSASV